MRRSELTDYIKETIVELLSEVSQEDVDTAKAYNDELQRTKELQADLADLAEDVDDKEAVANPDDSVAKIADKIQKNIEKRLAVLDQWKKAEGKEKEELLNRLKALSKTITDLEKLL